ncbi:MAG: hypothetical protein HZC44_09550 [Geobacter sp.]|nr:hypothetical protein [Geobacter sp.]
MNSTQIKAFLSHQFKDEYVTLIELILSICTGLDITCENVKHSSSDLPIDEAKRLIENSNLVIGICTKDKKYEATGKFSFSNAVQQELTIAYDLGKPIAMFVEDGVDTSGFYSNMCTYDSFTWDNCIEISIVEKFIKGIHREKVKSLTDKDMTGGSRGFRGQYTNLLNILSPKHLLVKC